MDIAACHLDIPAVPGHGPRRDETATYANSVTLRRLLGIIDRDGSVHTSATVLTRQAMT